MLEHSIILFFLVFTFGDTHNKSENQIDPCDIFGTIYVTKDIRKANYRVYRDDSELNADLVIFKEDNALMASKSGLWYEVESIGFADYAIYFDDQESTADFSIHYTDVPVFAGCN